MENRKVPKLRFKEFTEEWEEKRLGEIGEIITGKTPSTKEQKYWNGDIQFVTPTDMKGNKYQIITERNINENFSTNILPIGTIMFTCIASIGKMSISIKKCITNQQINSLIVNKNFSNEYIYYVLLTLVPKIQASKATTTMPIINKTDFSKILIKISLNLQEQQKIADFLSSVDTKISLTEEKLENLKIYKKGIMQKIFSQEIRFKDKNGNDYPEWEEKRLGEIAKYRRGSFPQPYGLKKWYDEKSGKPFIQVYDVDNNLKLKKDTKNKISKLAEQYSVFAERGTVIITLQGSIGRVAKMQYSGFIDRTLLIFEEYYIKIAIDFFKYVLFLIFEEEKRKAPGGIIKTITKEALSSFIIQLPILEEQQKIADFLSSIDNKIEKTENKLNELKEFKKGLLQKMFV